MDDKQGIELNDNFSLEWTTTYYSPNALPLPPAPQIYLVSDEDHEAYGAMLHAMTPREDRKD